MPELDIFFLDVGQGDGTWIECPNGTKILVDLGSKKNGELVGGGSIEFIKKQLGVSKTIDYLFLTHGDGDHYNLLESLCDAIAGLKFTNVYIGGIESDYTQWVRTNIFNKATKFRIFKDCDYDQPGSPRWQFGEVNLYLLSANVPTRNAGYKNEKSLVLMFEYATRRVILTGDAESLSEDRMVSTNYTSGAGKNLLKSFALKLGHHGSVNATTEAWLKAVQAGAYFASGDQKWGHPYCEVYNRIISAGYYRKTPSFKHGFVCGKYNAKTKDYDWENWDDSFYLFSNIYLIEENGAVSMDESDGPDDVVQDSGDSGWSACGTHYGLYFDKDTRMVQIAHAKNLKGFPENTGWFTP